MTARERRRLVTCLAISIVVATLLSIALWNRSFNTLQSLTTDKLFQTWKPADVRDAAARVVIVGIDDNAIRELGRFGNWPRRSYLPQRLRRFFDSASVCRGHRPGACRHRHIGRCARVREPTGLAL